MPWWVMLFANGTVLYIGAAMACIGPAARIFAEKRLFIVASNCLGVLGAIGVVASAAPLAWWEYAVWGVVWLSAMYTSGCFSLPRKHRVVLVACCAVVSAAICGVEARYWFLPRLEIPKGATLLYEVGDSLSIGADKQELNWPDLLGAKLGLPARNYSFGGAKAGTALSNAKRVGPEPAMVLLEIGGNDIFAGTPPQQFEQDLRALLEAVRAPDHTLYMLELPLPPTFNEYGRIQRALAEEFNVTLIPKRVLGGVFSIPDATVDGLHFSHAGHAALAERLAALFGK